MTIILAIGLIVLALLAPTFFCAGFYYGYNTASDVLTKQMVEKENIPGAMMIDYTKQAMRERMHEETEEERLARILAENVENFGTNVPQKEVV